MIEFIINLKENGKPLICDKYFSVEKWADKMGISTKTLTKKCKKITGVAPGKLIRTARYELAMSLLQARVPLNNKELAQICGYTGGEGLNNMIKKTTGLTTTELRKSYERGN